MILLPRLARSLHHPGLAAALGVVLLGICIFGLISGDIPTLWAVLIGVVGAINLMRLLAPAPDEAVGKTPVRP
jgi:hypothetical protein